MSWQSYIDDSLMCTLPSGSTLTSAAIFGQDGNVWAQSTSFPAITPAEVAKIMAAFDDTTALATSGMYLASAKYMVIQGEPGVVIRGKKEKPSPFLINGTPFTVIQGTGGVCIKKTTSALVFGVYEEPTSPGECNVVVESLGDYLISQSI